MKGWTTFTGQAVCLDVNDIDTDQLIPARFMSQPRVEGYADFLLHDMRRNADGTPKPDFILTQHPDATVLLAGKNFGSGSSREAAVYALLDSGIQVVIAESFGDIFASNAINNGVLPAVVNPENWHALRRAVSKSSIDCKVDLDTATLCMGQHTVAFTIDEAWRLKLINGKDDTDLTRDYQSNIDQFRKIRYQQYPWARPAAQN